MAKPRWAGTGNGQSPSPSALARLPRRDRQNRGQTPVRLGIGTVLGRFLGRAVPCCRNTHKAFPLKRLQPERFHPCSRRRSPEQGTQSWRPQEFGAAWHFRSLQTRSLPRSTSSLFLPTFFARL